jgi:putative transposase
VVSPQKRNRKSPRNYDKELYKESNLIVRFFVKLKYFRRIAARYDKLLLNYMCLVKPAATVICLR